MIHLLDIHISNLIAAGEVVDRPSSALKELVENSVDAKAKIITVEIKGGGISYMRVTDNGEGMDAEDLGRSVLRHATSKIKDEKDLAKIQTLGFRGEALAAISSVADLKIFTKPKDAQVGYMLESSSGRNTKIAEAGCAGGTTVVIERLFSKIPARQKFLKRDVTEGMYCKGIMEKIALSNPFVSFKFIQDGKQKIFTPGNGNYKDTIYSIFGDETADTLLQAGNFDGASGGGEEIKVYGFVSKIENGQKTRANENFFVNGRYVYSKTIMSALEEAYKSISETGDFPVCALYIKIDESKIDINVHPQKMEIKFSDEKQVYSAVYYAVKEALGGFGDLNADFVIKEHKKEKIKEKEEIEEENNTNAGFKSKYFDFTSKKPDAEIPHIPPPAAKYSVSETSEKTPSYETQETYDYKILGEAFYGYILIEKAEKIVIIDKHAAHERIIYDIIIKKAEKSKNPQFKSQILLVPEEVALTPKESAGILDIENEIKNLGIVFEWKDDNTVLITEVPSEISDANTGEIIREAAYLSSEGNPAAHQTVFEKLAMLSAKKSAACKAAMKSGIRDSAENISWLVDKVLNYENVKYCPHGRPVAFEITKSEIEKQFKR